MTALNNNQCIFPELSLRVFLMLHDVVPVACAVGLALFCCPPHPAFASQQRPGKVPVQARFRSDNYAAVLRLQNTQPKDRRIYTALTGILVVQQPVQLRKAGRGRRGRRKLQAARGKHEQ